jgi:tRNA A-37 threonylcarbamoyl transferase component Bud32
MEQETLRGGRYVVMKVLGEGAQGSTFEAVDKKEGRLVAIKRFDVRGAKAWKDVELAEREARVLASLHHPKLPAYIEHFEEGGRLYLVMEKIEGDSLAHVLHEHGRFDEPDVRALLRDAADALGYLHGKGVVHRDLKPGNILRRKDGSFAFVDFGAVRDRMKVEGGSTVVGTFGYMAPEQFQGRARAASDVYAIGATALAMLTGKEPEDLPHRGLAVDVSEALGGLVSKELTIVLARMLEPDPDRRASSIELPRGAKDARGARPARSSEEDWGDGRRSEGWDDAKGSESWNLGRAEAKRAWRKARRARRDARRAARRARRVRGPGAFPIFFVLLGLAVARVAISVALFVVVPLVLQALSLVFGRALREAAEAVTRGGRRAYEALDEQARALGAGAPDPPNQDGVRSRVDSTPRVDEKPRVRVEASNPDEAWAEEEEPASGRGSKRERR